LHQRIKLLQEESSKKQSTIKNILCGEFARRKKMMIRINHHPIFQIDTKMVHGIYFFLKVTLLIFKLNW